jgi:uncharacterized protein HemX
MFKLERKSQVGKRKFPMKRIAVFALLVALSAGWSIPTYSQGATEYDRRAEKAAQKQQTAVYKYQQKQQKAQAKAQRKADKQQQKAAKKYDKEQRKLLKNQNLPAKHTS